LTPVDGRSYKAAAFISAWFRRLDHGGASPSRNAAEASMTTAARRRRRWRWRIALGSVGILLLATPWPGSALVLDDRGEMRLGMRAYTAVRIGTEKMGGDADPLTFPASAAGHVRQHRYFLELKLDHDIRRLGTTTKGLASLLGWMNPNSLRYSLQ